VAGQLFVIIDPMKRDGTESCPLLTITLVINTGAPPMTTNIDTCDVCCAALELSKTSWVCAFAAPGDGTAAVHKIKAGDVDRLMDILNGSKAKTERSAGSTAADWDEQPTRPSLAGKYDRADLRLHFGIRGDPFLHLRGD
jgi:hypothetical protein